MKKTFFCIICLAAVMMMAFTTVASAATTWYVKTPNGKSVNVRSAPYKAEGNVVDQIPYGMMVEVVDFTARDLWAQVRVSWKGGVLEGYIQTSFLVDKKPAAYKETKTDSKDTQATDETLASLNKVAKAIKVLEQPYTTVIQTKVATNYVHLRWFPDTNAVYSSAYLCNTEIEVLAESKTWAQVRILDDGKVGFILKSCVAPVAD